ncbi:MAG: hypothetical protein VYA34_08730 [Myxococcota bacterium]|nr:hypothetical protein [Myxococcota bacterium]
MKTHCGLKLETVLQLLAQMSSINLSKSKETDYQRRASNEEITHLSAGVDVIITFVIILAVIGAGKPKA